MESFGAIKPKEDLESINAQIEAELGKLKAKLSPHLVERLQEIKEDKEDPKTRWERIQTRYENIQTAVNSSLFVGLAGIGSAIYGVESAKSLDITKMDPQLYTELMQRSETFVAGGGIAMWASIGALVVGHAANILNRRIQNGN